MDDSCETLWRSIESSFNENDLSSAEASFKSFTGSTDDVSGGRPLTIHTPQKCCMSVDEGLVNALRELQLASVKKPCQFKPSIILRNDNQGFDDGCPEGGVVPTDNFVLQSEVLDKEPRVLFSIIPEDLNSENQSEDMKQSVQLIDDLQSKLEDPKEVVELFEEPGKLDVESSICQDSPLPENKPDVKELSDLVEELVDLPLLMQHSNVQCSVVGENPPIENNPEDICELVKLVDDLVGSLQVDESNIQSIPSEDLLIETVTSECVESLEETAKSSDCNDLLKETPLQGAHLQRSEDSKSSKITTEAPQALPALPSIASNVQDNMKKAVKSLLKPPSNTRKTTIGVSPVLQTKARCRVPKTSILLQSNHLMTNNQVKKKVPEHAPPTSSSWKRQPAKNIVATVVSTKEGIRLKEEKISNFGIPVNMRKKKRTQAIPFSFATREKDLQHQQEKKSMQKLPMRDSNSVNQEKSVIIRATEKKVPAIKSRSIMKTSLSEAFLNKENSSMNLNKYKPLIGERRNLAVKGAQSGRKIEGMRTSSDMKQQPKEKISDSGMKIEANVRSAAVHKVPAPMLLKQGFTVSRK
ncbi:uncharacterized protein LOC135161806 [Diachasmimorpha longicaudata]|uniref:uncharacterized protein LOC135161806 n=1 Tax=Diachasmimorpha longicaudata TaxID=58733 RepID=UPI0030B8883C